MSTQKSSPRSGSEGRLSKVASSGKSEMNGEELSKHILWLEGAAQSLIARGLLKGPVAITSKGIAAYEQLIASGWRPQPQIVRRLLCDKGIPAAQLDEMTKLFLRLLSDKTG